MSEDTPDPWARWRETAARLFPKLTKRDAVPESEVAAAEKRLGVRLPARLRELYRISGRRRDLHTTHDRLFATNKLIFVPPSTRERTLVFYEQQDSAAAWGISSAHVGKDLAKDDPPVVRAQNRPPFVWEPDHDSVSSFFFTELLWQHVNATPNAVVEVGAATLDAVAARFDPIALEGCRWDVLGCWGRDGTVLFARGPTRDHIRLYVGTTSEEALASTLADLGLKNSAGIP